MRRSAADIVAPGDVAIGDGHALEGPGIARIAGLQDVLGEGVTHFEGGNILLRCPPRGHQAGGAADEFIISPARFLQARMD